MITPTMVLRRAAQEDFVVDTGWFYARRKDYPTDEIQPVYITGGHRVRAATSYLSVSDFDWFGRVPICVATSLPK